MDRLSGLLDTNPTAEEIAREVERTVQDEGKKEAGVHGVNDEPVMIDIYNKQIAGSTVIWDRYCARVTDVELKELSPEEGEKIERKHLDIDEIEAVLQARDEHGEYIVKEDLSRAEIALWLLQNKYWNKSKGNVCVVCGK